MPAQQQALTLGAICMTLHNLKIISLTLVVILIVLSAYLFFKGQNIDIDNSIDANRFNQFGGFVGGIVTSVSIFLVILTYFFSLKSSETQKIENYINAINCEINEASFNGKKGTDAYLAYDMNTNEKHIILDNLNLVITTFNSLIKTINNNKLIPKTQKNEYKNRLYLIYYTKVLWPLHDTITSNGLDFIVNKKHDDSAITLPKYADLGIQCVEYLRANGISASSDFKTNIISKLEEIRKTALNKKVLVQ